MNINDFWKKKGLVNYALYPLALLWQLGTLLRKQQKPYKSSKFVICLGNINLGGSGKTPTAIALGLKLTGLGYKVAFLTKGYKGSLNYPKWVEKQDDSTLVGDEALLLSKHLPTMVSKRLKLGLIAIESEDFEIVIIDDGLQNPTIFKDYSILVVNGSYGFGNNLIFPMGPLRESISKGIAKSQAMIILEEDEKELESIANIAKLTVIKGYYEAVNYERLLNKDWYAFCGIGMPDKFKKTLDKYGLKVKKFKSFSDHYSYNEEDISKLIAESKANHLSLITTMKDYVRISDKYKDKIMVFEIEAKLLSDINLTNQLEQLIGKSSGKSKL